VSKRGSDLSMWDDSAPLELTAAGVVLLVNFGLMVYLHGVIWALGILIGGTIGGLLAALITIGIITLTRSWRNRD